MENKRIDMLTHPLVTSLLNSKWKKYGCAVYFLNLTTFIFFLIFLTVFALISLNPHDNVCKFTIIFLCLKKIWNLNNWFKLPIKLFWYNFEGSAVSSGSFGRVKNDLVKYKNNSNGCGETHASTNFIIII